jgi:cation transport ATPase
MLHEASDLDVLRLGDQHNKILAEKASLLRQKEIAESQGNHDIATAIQDRIGDLGLKEVGTFEPLVGTGTTGGRILRAMREVHEGGTREYPRLG